MMENFLFCGNLQFDIRTGYAWPLLTIVETELLLFFVLLGPVGFAGKKLKH